VEWIIFGASHLWGESSLGRDVHGAKRLCSGMSFHGAKCPWGEMSVGQKVLTPQQAPDVARSMSYQFSVIWHTRKRLFIIVHKIKRFIKTIIIAADRRCDAINQLLNYLLSDQQSECKLGKIDSVISGWSVRVQFGFCSSCYDLLTYLPHPNRCFALGSRSSVIPALRL